MSPRAWRERIRDILDAVVEITDFTQGIAFDAFRYDANSPPYTFFLLDGDMELNRNRQLFV